MPGDADNLSLPPAALRGLSDEQTERLSRVLDDYLAALETGKAPELVALLQQHPDLSEPLSEYLGKLSELHNFAAGFSPHLTGGPEGYQIGSSEPHDKAFDSLRSDTSTDRMAVNDTSSDDGLSKGVSDPLLPLGLQARRSVEKVSISESSSKLDSESKSPRVPTRLLQGELDATADNPAARRLGDFELIRVVGRGGMDIVYEAEQLSLRRRVALKLVPLVSVLDAKQIVRFKNEAQAAASLQMPLGKP